jgi:4-hydroxy-2-oxoheptanedioate aldolase
MSNANLRANSTKSKLAAGGVAFGCFVRYPDAGLVEFLATTGLDFLVFDGEHGTLTPQLCENLVRAAELHEVTPIVRVEENNAALILRYLDTGASGCHVPGVETVEDAVSAARSARFAPDGSRGLSAARASGFGPSTGYPTYIEQANSRMQVIVHIETQPGVESVESIAAVPGVDILLLGSLDLSLDLGIPGQVDHPAVLAAAERIAEAAQANGRVFGAVASNADDARRWINCGARYVVFPVEAFIKPTVTRYLDALRPAN